MDSTVMTVLVIIGVLYLGNLFVTQGGLAALDLNTYNFMFLIAGMLLHWRPRAFLRLTSDKFIDTALQLEWPQLLYGRSNSLGDAQERPLAEIVEILPPA